ncbi:hypothetical protein [Paenibacillus lutimineralis]|uniref:Uncharacterized protein n=1 Tax=Paenibacillus lutimineralis TaxID=2707005 RepID=A0A3Q9I9U5_9BACL|nr:hypothetical protein [Paenibacillus lutimineralis]AZS14325.1 hypothetical protein EI981_07545 [Paenibacillus lutimineralis]
MLSNTEILPTEDEVNTLKHALRVLNENEIIEAIQEKIDIPSSVNKAQLLKQFIISNYQKGGLEKEIFDILRVKAFNPELDLTDGFYLSLNQDAVKLTEIEIHKIVKEWNEKEDVEYESKIEILGFNDKLISFLVTKKIEKFVYDSQCQYSTKYTDDHQVVIEYHYNHDIVFFQTTNTVKYSSVKTVMQDFFKFLLNDEEIKLSIPKFTPRIEYKLKKDGWTVTSSPLHNISPTTLKLLDLFSELDKEENNFSHFECIDIKFDHENTGDSSLLAKVNSQSYDGGDLLATDDVKQIILNNRVILFAEFKITYIEEKGEDIVRYHSVLAGIQYDRKKRLRIYIKNNDLGLKRIVKQAYSDLKKVFIQNYSDDNLKNEEKIESLLGIQDENKEE